ncbi:hypothetical protein AB0A77_28370 [Streptomyces varsoviensis]|uniref:hypothetical protein n=1 Tax=Streptomyces varsoviensis TaxID=67373 RepID=UPI00340760FF
MSDREDQWAQDMGDGLGHTYTMLTVMCLRLPIEISLPTGTVSNLETVPAVRRVLEIIEDLPMSEEDQADLFAACSFWLAAMDVYWVFTKQPSWARVHSVWSCLYMVEDALTSLALKLPGEQE